MIMTMINFWIFNFQVSLTKFAIKMHIYFTFSQALWVFMYSLYFIFSCDAEGDIFVFGIGRLEV